MRNAVFANSQSGFTLLEIMASLAILGIGVIMVLRLFSGGLGLAGYSRDHTEMALLAREKLSEGFLESNLNEGIVSGFKNGMEWKVEVTPYEAQNINTSPNVRIVKVTASVRGIGQKKSAFSLTSLKTVFE